MGFLQQRVTWYTIRHTGGQAYYSSTGESKTRKSFGGCHILLPSSIADFVHVVVCCKRPIFERRDYLFFLRLRSVNDFLCFKSNIWHEIS